MFETITRDHVQQAIEECDSLGADTFQRRYGFGQARHYAIWHDGRTYDSKAILGVAQRYATGEAAMVTEFDGSQQDAALLLRDLGLDVIVDRGEVELPRARRTRSSGRPPTSATKPPAPPGPVRPGRSCSRWRVATRRS